MFSLLVDIWDDSSLRLLWIKLPYTFVYKSLYRRTFSCLLSGLLGRMVSVNFFLALSSSLEHLKSVKYPAAAFRSLEWFEECIKGELTRKSHWAGFSFKNRSLFSVYLFLNRLPVCFHAHVQFIENQDFEKNFYLDF